MGLGWGVTGVAFATFIAEWSGAFLGLWFCRAVFAGTDWRNAAQVFNRARWVRMMKLNSDILIRSLLLEAIFVSFMFTGARMGDVTLASNQVLMQFLMLTSFALDGLAFGGPCRGSARPRDGAARRAAGQPLGGGGGRGDDTWLCLRRRGAD